MFQYMFDTQNMIVIPFALRYNCDFLDVSYIIQHVGCFADIVRKRDLEMKTTLISSKMTHKMCLNHCKARGYKYMGLQVNI